MRTTCTNPELLLLTVRHVLAGWAGRLTESCQAAAAGIGHTGCRRFTRSERTIVATDAEPSAVPQDRWHGQERLWAQLASLRTVAVKEDPESDLWTVFNPADAAVMVPLALLSQQQLHDLSAAGVNVVYRR